MRRLFASILLILAATGLVLSPAAACQMGTPSTPAMAVAAKSSCHEAAEAPAKPAPLKSDNKGCCKSMCAPAMPVADFVLRDPTVTLSSADAWSPLRLAGLTHALDKPPPRILT